MSWYARAVVGVLFAGLAAPVTITAQLSRPQFGVAAGATFASGDYNKLWGFNVGWQGMALVAFPIRHSPVALRLDGSYGTSTSSDAINGGPTESRVKLLGGDADLTLTLVSPLSLARTKVYLLVGPGLYRISHNQTQPYQSAYTFPEQTKFAYNLGGGFTVGALFFEARYVHVGGSAGDGFANSLSWIMVPITAGVRFGSR